MTLPPPTLTSRSASGLPRGLLDGAAGRMLAHPDVGATVLLTKQPFDAAHEVGLFVQGSSGDDERPLEAASLLFEPVQGAGAEVDAARRQGPIGPGLHHGPDFTRGRLPGPNPTARLLPARA